MRFRTFSLNWRWGIGAHLGVAFAAVVALAIAANLLIEHEISVVRTTRTVRVEASPAFAPGVRAPGGHVSGSVRPSDGVHAQMTDDPTAPRIEVVNVKPLVVALEHYADAVRNRLDINTVDSDSQLTTAGRALQREIDLYTSTSFSGTSVAEDRLLRRFAEFRALGLDLVRAASERRSALKDFGTASTRWMLARRPPCRGLENFRPRHRAQDAR